MYDESRHAAEVHALANWLSMPQNQTLPMCGAAWKAAFAAGALWAGRCPRCKGEGGAKTRGAGMCTCPVCGVNGGTVVPPLIHLNNGAGETTCQYVPVEGETLTTQDEEATCVPCLRAAGAEWKKLAKP